MTLARRTLTPAGQALRSWWGTAVLLAAAAAAALAVLLPAAGVVGTGPGWPSRLHVSPAGGLDLEVIWGAMVRSPDAIRAAAVSGLSHLLLGVAAGVLAVTWLTQLALSTARATARGPEVTVRRAVGATRLVLLASFLLEGAFIAVVALAVGGASGLVAARVAVCAWPGSVGAGAPGLGLVAAAAVVLGLGVGALLPLVFARPGASLVRAEEASLALVVPAVQIGVSLTVLVAGSLLGARARAQGTAGGGAPAGEVYAIVTRDSTPGQRASAYASLLRELGAESSVATASLASRGSALGLGPVDVVGTDCGACMWGGLPLPWHSFFAVHELVSADSFRSLGLRLVAGRAIAATDDWGAPRVAVVSRSLATLHFEAKGAVGRSILVGHGSAALYTVVGVVEDRPGSGFGAGLEPPDVVYLSVLQHPAAAVELLVRPRAPAGRAAEGGQGVGPGAVVERAVRGALGPRLAGLTHVSEAGMLAAEAAPLAWFGGMFGASGAALVAIATLGVFATMWLWVGSLLRELGVRRAVGARRRDLFGFVMLRAGAVAAGGIVFGTWLGMMVWDALTTVVAGLPAWDAHAVLRSGALLGAATLAGALVPAWRAARRTPAALIAAP
ncbi:MAG TPA: FtsX-like permease family protein [Gemmatimonadales bacterium]|nr:FtsX-like permease family protein [Gemmatimonadales bacterium]